MSYCRWSSDNHACDVYVYKDYTGCFMTHVAANKPIGVIPPIPKMPLANNESEAEWVAASKARHKFLDTCERAPIGLKHDGATFMDDTPGECADRLESLSAMGYNVPQYAIDALREEQQDLDNMENKE